MQEKKGLNIFDQKHTLNNQPPFLSPFIFAAKSRANEFCPDLASPDSVLSKVMSFLSVLSIVMIKLQVRVLRLTKYMIILKFHLVYFAHPIWFGLGTVPVESLDCKLSKNVYFYVCHL